MKNKFIKIIPEQGGEMIVKISSISAILGDTVHFEQCEGKKVYCDKGGIFWSKISKIRNFEEVKAAVLAAE